MDHNPDDQRSENVASRRSDTTQISGGHRSVQSDQAARFVASNDDRSEETAPPQW